MQNNIRFAIVLCLAGFMLGFSTPSRADDTYVFNIEAKQKAKSTNRWSISEWLETRDKMRLMDLWFALHSPSPYEFYLGGSYKTGSRGGPGGYYGGWDGVFAAYAYLFGLELQRQISNVESRWIGLVDFRIFGYHNQATNLTLQAGVKNISRGGTSFTTPVAGATVTIYLAKGFGVEGMYRHGFSPTSGSVGGAQDRIEGGAFIDFSFVRIFGDYFSDSEAGYPGFSYTGGQLGTRVYF